MFDDQDDLEFVKLCDIGFAPVISHPLVRMFIENRQKQQTSANDGDNKYSSFESCPQEGLLGTEYALQKMIDICREAKEEWKNWEMECGIMFFYCLNYVYVSSCINQKKKKKKKKKKL